MAAKITAFLVTLMVDLAAGVVILFMMLLAMNGFHESDATWGLGAFIILAILVSLLMSTGALLLVRLLLKKQFSSTVSALIAVPLFSVIGIGLEIICSLIGIGIAEYVRVNY
jgi:hypothetical protein